MIAGFSDGAGRRPAYIYCFIVYIAANIGLALQRNYAALLVLRCLQSAGSSGTVALCVGVVADLITSEERGIYVGYTSVPGVMGPVVGPIIGGVIAQVRTSLAHCSFVPADREAQNIVSRLPCSPLREKLLTQVNATVSWVVVDLLVPDNLLGHMLRTACLVPTGDM